MRTKGISSNFVVLICSQGNSVCCATTLYTYAVVKQDFVELLLFVYNVAVFNPAIVLYCYT